MAHRGRVLLTVLNYAILVGYDWFAVRWVGEKDLPLRKIALASFTGYAFSYNFGATLFGTSIRYRLYSAWGMSLRKILDLLVILGLTFWFGVFTLAGVVFMATPFQIPRGALKHLNFLSTRRFGWGWCCWCWRWSTWRLRAFAASRWSCSAGRFRCRR